MFKSHLMTNLIAGVLGVAVLSPVASTHAQAAAHSKCGRYTIVGRSEHHISEYVDRVGGVPIILPRPVHVNTHFVIKECYTAIDRHGRVRYRVTTQVRRGSLIVYPKGGPNFNCTIMRSVSGAVFGEDRFGKIFIAPLGHVDCDKHEFAMITVKHYVHSHRLPKLRYRYGKAPRLTIAIDAKNVGIIKDSHWHQSLSTGKP